MIRPASNEFHPLGIAAVLVRQWRMVLGVLAAALTVAVLIILFYPRTYTARTVLVLSGSEPETGAQLLASQLGASLPNVLGGSNSDKQLISAILESRALADSIAGRLVQAPDTAAQAEVSAIVLGGTDVTEEPNGSIAVEVSDRAARRAARIANEFPAAINQIVSGIGTQDARLRRDFLEEELEGARRELEESEQRLVGFQQSSDAPELQEQTRRTVETAAALQQEIMQNEIRVAQLRRTATPSNPQLRAAVAELGAQKEQLRRVTAGRSGSESLLLSLEESPELKATNLRLLREFTKDEQVYLSLTSALAQSGIDVNNQLPVVSVLDVAIIPQSPSSPNARLVLGLAIALGLLVGVVAAFVRDYARNARQDPEAEPFFAAWKEAKDDAVGYIPRRVRTGGAVSPRR